MSSVRCAAFVIASLYQKKRNKFILLDLDLDRVPPVVVLPPGWDDPHDRLHRPPVDVLVAIGVT